MGKRKPQSSAADPIAPEKPRRVHLAAIGAVWAVALAAYANSFASGLVFDNRFVIAADTRIQAATTRNIGLILTRDYWFGAGPGNLYRPLTTLSYLFNYSVLGNGADPAGYHLLNFAIHAINIALVYALALWILAEMRLALAMTALWALHPALTEAVTNVVGRADLLAACGVLAALCCHIQARRSQGRRRTWWLVGLALSTAVGIFSKESAIVAPAILLLYDLAFAEKEPWRSRMANYAAAVAPCLLYLAARGQALAHSLTARIAFIDNPLTTADFWTARLTALRVIGKYIGLLLWPGALSADYSYNQIPLFRAGDFWALLAVAVCLALAAVGVWAFHRHRPVFFFVGLFFLCLAPVGNVFLLIGTVMAERFLYLPALALAGSVALGLRAMQGRLGTRNTQALLAAICIAFAVRAYVRNADWATEQTLMTSAARSAPAACRPHIVLATLLSGSGAAEEADKARAILDPVPDDRNFGRGYVSIGISYRSYGDTLATSNPEQARQWYRKSLDALARAQAIARANLQDSKPADGFTWDQFYIELGRTRLALKQPREALEALQQGRHATLHPEFFFEEMANAYRDLGDIRQQAVSLFGAVMLNAADRQVSRETANLYNAQLTSRLVDLYRQTDPGGCAIRQTGRSQTLDQDCPLVKEQFCAAFRELSRDYPTGPLPAGCPKD